MKKIFVITLILAGFASTYWSLKVMAVDTELNFIPPCPAGGGNCQTVSGKSISEYIVRLYQFGVGFAGILAVGMIAAGAIYRGINAGNPGKQKEGEDMIKSAIWGIVLLLGSYLILKTINPELVKLDEPQLQNVDEVPLGNLAPIPDGEEQLQYISSSTNPATVASIEAYANQDYATLRPDSRQEEIAKCVPELGGRCEPLDASLPMKPNQCRWQQSANVPSKCWVQPQANVALKELNNMLSGPYGPYSINAFTITEAFPPVVKHETKGHYNGCSVDVAIVTQPEGLCATLQTVMRFAQEAGFNATNEYPQCGGRAFETTTGGNLHLTKQNCP